MLEGVSRLTGLVFVIGSTAAVAGPAGRVVRVERAGGTSVAPRLCELRGDAGTCVGDEPKVGEIIVVLDEQHVIAEVQIVAAPTVVASCANLWTVKTRPSRGAVSDGEGIGVIDPSLDLRRAHVLDKSHLPASPSGLAGDEVWRAIDRDGDGAADIVFTHYSCDSAGALVSGGAQYCLDIWSRTHTRMARTTQLNFAQCNI
jgi:hypothetical protein